MRGKQLDPTDVPVPEGDRIFVDKRLRPYQGQGRPASNIQLPGVQDYPEWQPVDPFLERVALGEISLPQGDRMCPAHCLCADAALLVPTEQSLNGLAGGTGSEGRSSQGSAGSSHHHASTASKTGDSQKGAFAIACTCLVLCMPRFCWDRLPSQQQLSAGRPLCA